MRYRVDGNWYKGNTHIHSVFSDGGWTFEELATAYAGAGYDFLCRTDHWVASDAATEGEVAPLLWLDGVELDGHDERGSYYHVVCLGTFTGIAREMGFEAALQATRIQNAFTILAHPYWTGNSFDEAQRWGFDGVEIYNHVCQWLNGKGNGAPYWHAMLASHPDTLAIACDDAHVTPAHPGWNGGWVMVQAEALTVSAIVTSLRAGQYYSSMGPSFLRIEHVGRQVAVEVSPVQFIRLVGPGSRGQRVGSFDGSLLTEAVFDIPDDWAHAYLEIEDTQRRRAWTNTL
ncbi:MAG: hypothetical protein JXC32_15035 [Anaerolineae bacterium]|nr:hypothetical protein [Anaerolineae bacterium]